MKLLRLCLMTMLCAPSLVLAAPAANSPKPNPADLSRFTPQQQYRYAHLLLDADSQARQEAGCDPVLDDGAQEDFALYQRLRTKYQLAVEHRYRISRLQGLALLREAYVKNWNNT